MRAFFPKSIRGWVHPDVSRMNNSRHHLEVNLRCFFFNLVDCNSRCSIRCCCRWLCMVCIFNTFHPHRYYVCYISILLPCNIFINNFYKNYRLNKTQARVPGCVDTIDKMYSREALIDHKNRVCEPRTARYN